MQVVCTHRSERTVSVRKGPFDSSPFSVFFWKDERTTIFDAKLLRSCLRRVAIWIFVTDVKLHVCIIIDLTLAVIYFLIADSS